MADLGDRSDSPVAPDGEPTVADAAGGLAAVRNPGSAVYGALTAGALMAAESPRRETYLQTAGAVVVALMLYWVAHAYAHLLGGRLKAGHRLTASGLLEELGHELPILLGAVLPLAALAVAGLAGTTLSDAVIAAVWTSAATIVGIEVAAGLRARLPPWQLAGQTVVGAALGLPIILLRVILH